MVWIQQITGAKGQFVRTFAAEKRLCNNNLFAWRGEYIEFGTITGNLLNQLLINCVELMNTVPIKRVGKTESALYTQG